MLIRVYADDATVFIGPEGNPTELQSCLDLFCEASTARFNKPKTKIIPLRTPEDHEALINTRSYNRWKIEEVIHIAKDGEAIRILGSWQGNGISVQAKWDGIMEKQAKTMKRWLPHPSVAGRVLISKALIISLAYYLITFNEISQKNLIIMEKSIRKFIWNGRKGQMAWERAILPVAEGGVGTPSIKLRYEAIKIGWLERWWKPEPHRPDWAWVANGLIFQSANQKPPLARSQVREWIS